MSSYQAIADSEDWDDWEGKRATHLTATDLPKLAAGGTEAFLTLMEKKAGKGKPTQDNKWMAWGRQREPEIAKWVESEYGLKHNTSLFESQIDKRIAATPDLIDFGDALCGDIKTRCVDRGDDRRIVECPQDYYDQLQTQMFVMGVDESILVVEHYSTNPATGEFQSEWDKTVLNVPFDSGRMDFLLGLADLYYNFDANSEHARLLDEYLAANDAFNGAKLAKDESRKLIEKTIDPSRPFKFVSRSGSISRGADSTNQELVFDQGAFERDHPDLYREYLMPTLIVRKGVLRITPAKGIA